MYVPVRPCVIEGATTTSRIAPLILVSLGPHAVRRAHGRGISEI